MTTNTYRALRNPLIERVIVALILLAAGGVAILITIAWPLIHVASVQAPSQAGPWEVVSDFHAFNPPELYQGYSADVLEFKVVPSNLVESMRGYSIVKS